MTKLTTDLYKRSEQSFKLFRALNHKLRRSMLELLEKNEKLTVTDTYVKLRVEQSVASQHLAILRKAGLVNTERQGKFIFYSVNQERLTAIEEMMKAMDA